MLSRLNAYVLPLLWVWFCLTGCADQTTSPKKSPSDVGERSAQKPVNFSEESEVNVENTGSTSALGPNSCTVGVCDIFSDAGCLRDGAQGVCRLVGMSASCQLQNPVGLKNQDENCAQDTDCGPGLGCIALQSTTKVCKPLCCSYGNSCTAGKFCLPSSASGAPLATWGFCVNEVACDPVAKTGCGPGVSCYLVSERIRTTCLVPGTGSDGDTCRAANDCAPGLACVGVTKKTCRALCNINSGCEASAMTCKPQSYVPSGRGICVSGP